MNKEDEKKIVRAAEIIVISFWAFVIWSIVVVGILIIYGR